MAKVIIGGEELEGDLSNFAKLKRAWKYIEAAQGAQSMGDQMDAMIAVAAVAVGALKSKGAEGEAELAAFEERVQSKELKGLAPFFRELLAEAEITRPPGQAAPVVAGAAPGESGSTETSTP